MKRKEFTNICLIAGDSWSGNHLIRPRSTGYWKIRRELVRAFRSRNPSNRQRELMEAYISAGGEEFRPKERERTVSELTASFEEYSARLARANEAIPACSGYCRTIKE